MLRVCCNEAQQRVDVINDKFIVAQNVQNNKQMDSRPPPSPHPINPS